MNRIPESITLGESNIFFSKLSFFRDKNTEQHPWPAMIQMATAMLTKTQQKTGLCRIMGLNVRHRECQSSLIIMGRKEKEKAERKKRGKNPRTHKRICCNQQPSPLFFPTIIFLQRKQPSGRSNHLLFQRPFPSEPMTWTCITCGSSEPPAGGSWGRCGWRPCSHPRRRGSGSSPGHTCHRLQSGIRTSPLTVTC